MFGRACRSLRGGAAWSLAAPALRRVPRHATPARACGINTPNDPDFDRCEPDDEQGADLHERLRPAVSSASASRPTDRSSPPSTTTPPTRTSSACRRRTRSPGRNPLGQVPGVSADRAWKYSTGTASVQVAILDTGIRWNNGSLRKKVALNRGELPLPQHRREHVRAVRLQLRRRVQRRRLRERPARLGHQPAHDDEPGADSFLDASDLIVAFSDGDDDDGNGYVDDIAGWDFFDDDNNPYDASSYSSASTTAPGRAEEAGEQTNEGAGGIGVCPDVPDRADAGLGHVRGRHEQLRAGRPVRGRQRHRGRRGRGRRAVQLALRAQGVRARLPARASSSRSSRRT